MSLKKKKENVKHMSTHVFLPLTNINGARLRMAGKTTGRKSTSFSPG